MAPRSWNQRSVSGFLRQMNDGLDDMLYTMHRMESIVQEVQRMAPAWQELRNSLGAEPERRMNTREYAEARTKRRKKQKKRR